MSAVGHSSRSWPAPLVLAAARVLLTLRHPLMTARFLRRLGYLPNPALPRTYNERLLWRKMLDRNPLFVTLTDKIAVKTYIRERCPELAHAATLWVGDRPADIPQALLDGEVMVKTNNGSGTNLVVRRGVPDRGRVEKRTRRWLRPRHGRRREEWAYWLIQPTLLIEELLKLGSPELPTDIKVHVCGGVVAHVWAADRRDERSLLLDGDGLPLPGRDSVYAGAFPPSEVLKVMVREAAGMASVLAGDLDYIRVDFLATIDGLLAGEITVYPAAGYDTWSDPEIARRIERLWDLRLSEFMRRPQSGLTGLYAEALRSAAPGLLS